MTEAQASEASYSRLGGTGAAWPRELLEERRRFYDLRLATLLRAPARWYREQIANEFKGIVPEGCAVLEIGCGLGDLLAAVRPSGGVGVDFCPEAIHVARQLHPELEFRVCEAAEISLSREFDYILFSDLINDLPDVQAVFERLRVVAHGRTRLVLQFTNQAWYPVLRLAEWIGLKKRRPAQNWLSTGDVRNLLSITGWEVVRTDTRILWPLKTPLWATLCNRVLAPFLRPICLADFVIARPQPRAEASRPLRCSVVIPARNERGNIESAVQRIPELGAHTEIIFVEGHSTDGTWEEIQRVIQQYPQRGIRALKQATEGKGAAMREAFAAATSDVLLILDADLTTAPEELPKFYNLIASGMADFASGVRLVYPMEHEAMRFLNMAANKLFGVAFSWLLGQPLKDTLCGTKVLRKADYERIAANRRHFGDFDPFGDFDLLFGAARLNLRIVDLPVRYRARAYGKSNIHRWQHGWLLLRMIGIAAVRLKFGFARSAPTAANRAPETAGLLAGTPSDAVSGCAVPYRLDLAGGWLDQPFVSKHCAGPVITLCLKPACAFHERSGMASSTRRKAIELWETAIPDGDREKLARMLFSYENPPGTVEFSGSQDAIGIVFPGLNRLDYDGHYWPRRITSLQDEGCLRWLEDHLRLAWIGERKAGFCVLQDAQITSAKARSLAGATDACWAAIVNRDAEAFGRCMRASFEAQLSLFPRMADERVNAAIACYENVALGWKVSGAGGGGYLVLVCDRELTGASRLEIHRAPRPARTGSPLSTAARRSGGDFNNRGGSPWPMPRNRHAGEEPIGHSSWSS